MPDPVEERGHGDDIQTEPEPVKSPVKQCPVAEVGDDGIPNAERLAQYTEQWLCALREHAATAVEATRHLRDTSPPHGTAGVGQAQGGSSPSTSLPAGHAAPDSPETQASTTGQRVGGPSQEQGQEKAGRFKVQVPPQYPGVQYRKSKCLNDRYLRYAKLGTVVSGVVEDNGEWLRIRDDVFLPMKVNGMDILERLPGDVVPGGAKPKNNTGGGSFWFACGQGSLGDEEEVLNDVEQPNAR